MRRQKRVLAGTAAAVLLGASTIIAAAAPAQADAGDCAAYLEGAGYEISDGVTSACETGGSGQLGADLLCRLRLLATEVSTDHAARACELAGS